LIFKLKLKARRSIPIWEHSYSTF